MVWKTFYSTALVSILMFAIMMWIDDDPPFPNAPLGLDGGTWTFMAILFVVAQGIAFLSRFLKFYPKNIFLSGAISNILSLVIFYIVLFSTLYFTS